jgi:hypothetical protein
MWDFDNQGIVVNVIFPANPSLNLGSFKRSSTRTYYELQCAPVGGFFHIRMHEITADVEYHYRDYLIPTSLALLTRIGTMADFEKVVEYYYADWEGHDIRHMDKNEVLRRYIYLRFGEYVYVDAPGDAEALIPNTTRKVGEFAGAVLYKTIPVSALKEGEA